MGANCADGCLVLVLGLGRVGTGLLFVMIYFCVLLIFRITFMIEYTSPVL